MHKFVKLNLPSSDAECREGETFSHVLPQQRQERELLGVGSAGLEVVGCGEVREQGRLQGVGRTRPHHILQLTNTLWGGRVITQHA